MKFIIFIRSQIFFLFSLVPVAFLLPLTLETTLPHAHQRLWFIFIPAFFFFFMTIVLTKQILLKFKYFHPQYLKNYTEIGRTLSTNTALPLFGKLIILLNEGLVISKNYVLNNPTHKIPFIRGSEPGDIFIDAKCISAIAYNKRKRKLTLVINYKPENFRIASSDFLAEITEFSRKNTIELTLA